MAVAYWVRAVACMSMLHPCLAAISGRYGSGVAQELLSLQQQGSASCFLHMHGINRLLAGNMRQCSHKAAFCIFHGNCCILHFSRKLLHFSRTQHVGATQHIPKSEKRFARQHIYGVATLEASARRTAKSTTSSIRTTISSDTGHCRR
jgi:hypothetical protein